MGKITESSHLGNCSQRHVGISFHTDVHLPCTSPSTLKEICSQLVWQHGHLDANVSTYSLVGHFDRAGEEAFHTTEMFVCLQLICYEMYDVLSCGVLKLQGRADVIGDSPSSGLPGEWGEGRGRLGTSITRAPG